MEYLESRQGQQCQTHNFHLDNDGRSDELCGYYYWGRYRKPAVKTSLRAQNTTVIKKNSSNLVGYPRFSTAHKVFDEMLERDGLKTNMILSKIGTLEGKSQVGLLGNEEKKKFLSGCNAHKVFDKMLERDELKEKMISTKIGTFEGKSQVGLLRSGGKKKLLIECNENEYEWGLLETLEREKKKKLLSLYKSLYEVLKKEVDKDIMMLTKRVDQEAWRVLNGSGKVPKYNHIIGPVLGVDVGDEFDFRVELVVVGVHYHLIHGISYCNTPNGQTLACSIVSTEGYWDEMVKSDELIYTGEGGTFGPKDAKNQEMKRGNLALKNSIGEQNFVRVVRGIITKVGPKRKTKFVYDGLYKVAKCYNAVGPNGKSVFKFVLKRCLGQKVIDWEKYR